MADVKISALPAASTPLAGTELVPIVQSGVTDQVSVANLTAGRTVAAATVNVDANSASAAVRITQTGAGNALLVEDSASPDSTPFLVDASGNILAVHSTAVATQTGTCRFQSGTIAAYSAISGGTTTTNAGTIDLSRSRGTVAVPTIVSSGDSAGRVSFGAYDGTAFRELGKIEGVVDGTPGASDMPGRIVFSTTADGAATTTERMRIDNSGNVRVGTAALATNATNGFLYVPTCAGAPTGVPTAITGLAPIVVDSTNNKLYFYSGGAWRDAGP